MHGCKGLVYLLSILHEVIIIVIDILRRCLTNKGSVRRLLHHTHHNSSASNAASAVVHITLDMRGDASCGAQEANNIALDMPAAVSRL